MANTSPNMKPPPPFVPYKQPPVPWTPAPNPELKAVGDVLPALKSGYLVNRLSWTPGLYIALDPNNPHQFVMCHGGTDNTVILGVYQFNADDLFAIDWLKGGLAWVLSGNPNQPQG